MLVTGYYHKGVIEIPEQYRNLPEHTRVKVEIPDPELKDEPIDPRVDHILRRVSQVFGEGFTAAGGAGERSVGDGELFLRGIKESGKYGI
jgi:hypothetical protein